MSEAESQKRKLELLEKCFDTFCENGLENTSLKMLADACGVTNGSLLYYFESKDNLVIEATAHCMAKVEDDFMANSPQSVPDIERFLREMPLKEILSVSYTFISHCKFTRLIILDFIKEKKRMSVRDDLLNLLYIQTIHILYTSIPKILPHVLRATYFRPLMPAQIRCPAAPFRCMAAAICQNNLSVCRRPACTAGQIILPHVRTS